MKTCPACGDTYSERIDFCFADGTALVLMPSAMDAPVPRMAQGASAPAGRFRTDHDEPSIAPPHDASMPASAPPASAEEAPDPNRLQGHDDNTAPVVFAPEDEETVVAMPALTDTPVAASPVVPSAPVVASPPVAVVRPAPAPPPPMFDAADVDVAAEPEEPPPNRRAFAWFFGTATLIACLVVLFVVVMQGRTPVEAPPVVPVTPRVEATVREAPVAVQPEEVEAAPEVEVVEPTPPKPAPRTERRPKPEPKPEPVVRVVSKKIEPAPTPDKRPPRPTPPLRTASTPTVSAGASPWDAPAAEQEAVVEIASDPPGALVRVDGRLVGKTPRKVNLAYGTYQLELELDGYDVVTREINVQSGSPKFPVSLKPSVRSGNVFLMVPGWDGATLYVDGKLAGDVPLELRITEGSHVFELRAGDRRGTDRRQVSLAPSGITRLTLSPRIAGASTP